MPRLWKVHAGQYVYLWIPGVSFWSFSQSHPFMVTWWSEDQHGDNKQIALLLKIKDGFTKELAKNAKAASLFTLVDGPYGTSSDLGNYTNILLLATGIGIATQVPYVKEVIENYKKCIGQTRKISLIWQLDKESKTFSLFYFIYLSDI